MWTRLSSYLFCHQCVFCQESSANGMDLCQYCVADLPELFNQCNSCALPLPEMQLSALQFSETSIEIRCASCWSQPPPVRRSIACYSFVHPVDFLVRQLKFSATLKYARIMGELLASRVGDAGADDVDYIVPLPLSVQRYRERGFNQAEELACYASRKLALPLNSSVLQRRFHQIPQAQLGRRQRLSNIKGAFTCEASVANARIALVDDVMTTGATAFEAANTLLAAGAASVDVWVFARTP